MQIAIDNEIYQEVQSCVERQGISLDVAIEMFFVRLVDRNKAVKGNAVIDVVLSFLGAGEGAGGNDVNGKVAYYRYLEENYK